MWRTPRCAREVFSGWMQLSYMRTCWIMIIPAAFAMAESSRTPVLVELFTSEGCSSCPPADLLLSRLQQSQPIPGVEVITLSEHVDYWNQLGWRDAFSQRTFSERQREQSRRRGVGFVVTPQLLLNGRDYRRGVLSHCRPNPAQRVC